MGNCKTAKLKKGKCKTAKLQNAEVKRRVKGRKGKG
jgi:hypothetical protein